MKTSIDKFTLRTVVIVILLIAGLGAGTYALASALSDPSQPETRTTAETIDASLTGAFAVLRSDRTAQDALPDASAAMIRSRPDYFGANLSLSRKSHSAEGLDFFVIPGNGSVCVEIAGTSVIDGAGGGCVHTEDALDGDMIHASLTRGGIRVTGLLPDTASDARLVLANGDEVPVPIVNNVYSAEVTKSLAGVRFTLDGQDQERSTPMEMAPLSQEQGGKVVPVR
jgi:hypothetical protein